MGNNRRSADDMQARPVIPLLVPDMPEAESLIHYLVQIDLHKWYSNFGPLCIAFETHLRTHFFPELAPDSRRLVSCSNGTAAIELALVALALPPGARVLLPAFTFPATATAVIRAGLTPVFADVDEHSWQLTPDMASLVLTRTPFDVVLPVATLGMPYHALAWQKFARDTGIPVVIDAAAALGLQETCPGISVCYSLHATKAFGIGEGGVVVAADEGMGERIRRLANFGFNAGTIEYAGGNYKLSEYHAAVGLAQIQRLPLLRKRRERLRECYHDAAEALVPFFDFQSLPARFRGGDSVIALRPPRFHGAAALCLKPHTGTGIESLIQSLTARGIQTRRWYCPGLQCHPAFAHYETHGIHDDRMTVTEYLQNNVLGLPFHHHLQPTDIDDVVGNVIASLEQQRFSVNAV